MLRALALICLLSLAGCSPEPEVRVDRDRTVTRGMDVLEVRASGRVVRDGYGFRHQWPGVYFDGAFKGDKIVLSFDDPANGYRVQIDALKPIELPDPGRGQVTIEGLGGGRHRIRVDKVTEASYITGRIAFHVPAGDGLPPPPPRQRRIEFIGDSAMTGYGAHSKTRTCSPEEIQRLTDTPRGFAAYAAQLLGADYRINAISGRGLIRNYNGHHPEAAMVDVYPRSLPAEPGDHDDSDWRPQVVVLKLQADLVNFAPIDRWPTMTALLADYAERYGDFVADLHRRYPGAAFVILWFDADAVTDPAFSSLLNGAEATIRERARRAGVGRIEFMPLGSRGFEGSACDSHLSLADHARLAALLVKKIEAIPRVWR